MYYLRSRPAINAIKFTVDVEALLKESCEGFDLKQFNTAKDSTIVNEVPILESINPENLHDGKENINVNLLNRKESKESGEGKDEKQQLEKRAPLACPLRKKKKEGEQEDEECLACGS